MTMWPMVGKNKDSEDLFQHDIGVPEFYKFYSRFAKHNVTDRKLRRNIYHDLNREMADAIADGHKVILKRTGSLLVRGKKVSRFRNDRLDFSKVDWKKTWAMWDRMFPGIPYEEVNKIEGRPLVPRYNTENKGYIYYCSFLRNRNYIKRGRFIFIPSWTLRSKISKKVKNRSNKLAYSI